MTVNPIPEPSLLIDTRYVLASDSTEEYLYNADRARESRDERALYLIVDGHAYYPDTHATPDIWEGRDVHAQRSIA